MEHKQTVSEDDLNIMRVVMVRNIRDKEKLLGLANADLTGKSDDAKCVYARALERCFNCVLWNQMHDVPAYIIIGRDGLPYATSVIDPMKHFMPSKK